MTKPTKWHVRPTMTQISLCIRPVWTASSLSVQWVAKDKGFLRADSEDSDQTGRMPRLIWVFDGSTVTLLVLSWSGSFNEITSLPNWTRARQTSQNNMCTQRTKISLAIRQSDQSLRSPPEEGLGPYIGTHKPHAEVSDQTGCMPRLIWFFNTLTSWFYRALTLLDRSVR